MPISVPFSLGRSHLWLLTVAHYLQFDPNVVAVHANVEVWDSGGCFVRLNVADVGIPGRLDDVSAEIPLVVDDRDFLGYGAQRFFSMAIARKRM
jgi:hypothetical protein